MKNLKEEPPNQSDMDLKLTVLNLDTNTGSKGGDITVNKTGVSLALGIANKMGAKKGDYLLVAVNAVGGLYIGKKPQGIFGGHRLTAITKTSGRLMAQFKTSDYNLKLGVYILTGKTVRSEIQDASFNTATVEFFETRQTE